jgi:hypothetical protein
LFRPDRRRLLRRDDELVQSPGGSQADLPLELDKRLEHESEEEVRQRWLVTERSPIGAM